MVRPPPPRPLLHPQPQEGGSDKGNTTNEHIPLSSTARAHCGAQRCGDSPIPTPSHTPLPSLMQESRVGKGKARASDAPPSQVPLPAHARPSPRHRGLRRGGDVPPLPLSRPPTQLPLAAGGRLQQGQGEGNRRSPLTGITSSTHKPLSSTQPAQSWSPRGRDITHSHAPFPTSSRRIAQERAGQGVPPSPCNFFFRHKYSLFRNNRFSILFSQ
jgi:hypothetical protein